MATALSVLDTSPVVEGSTPAEALQRSVDLAVACDRWGYHRFWVAEHHGMRGVASAVPSITIAAAAAQTTAIRLGAGGVILPNHAPLDVAEQYGMLEGLFPGRIDLALGRALGGTEASVDALRPKDERTAHSFTEQIDQLERHFRPGQPGGVRAIPAEGMRPPLWVLGSSPYSATVAAARGLPYAFAHHLEPGNLVEALRVYRDQFTPSEYLDRPRCLVSVSVIAGENAEHAEWLAGSTRLKVVSRSHGRPIRLPSPEVAAGYDYTSEDRELIARSSVSVFTGDATSVGEGLDALTRDAEIDELMVAAPIHHHDDRLASYRRTYSAISPAAGSEPSGVDSQVGASAAASS